jgi:phosphoribosylformimino-5-aminoimidazole carboxamide ribonucleotide (ProFAR) isomerase
VEVWPAIDIRAGQCVIDRDGTGAGPHLGEYQWILEETDLPIIASGGVHSPSDIARLSRLANGTRRLEGVIVGRALLSGALSLSHAHEAATGFTR